MNKYVFVMLGLIAVMLQGLIGVGFLAGIELIVSAFQPSFSLPFPIWWGMVASLPGGMMLFVFTSIFKTYDSM